MRFLFLLLVCTNITFSQNKTLDSLKLALKNLATGEAGAKNDTTRCNILGALAETAPDGEWEKFNDELKQLAEKNLQSLLPSNPLRPVFKKHLANSLSNAGLIHQNQGDIAKALEYYGKSLKIHEEIGNKEGIAGSLHNLGYIYSDQGNIPKALEYYGKSLRIREEIGEKKGIAQSLNNIGYNYNIQGNTSKALEYFGKSLKIREDIGDKNGIGTCLNNIGDIYRDQGNIPKALEYFGKSLKISEEVGDKEGIAGAENNIGMIYQDQGDIPNALEYYGKSLKIWEQIGKKEGIATSLSNIGLIYYDKGDIVKALEYLGKGLKIREEIMDRDGMANSLNNIGYMYKDQGDLPKALEYYGKSLKIREDIGDKVGTAYCLNNIGVIYFNQKNYSKALEFSSKSMKISKELAYPENIRNAAQLLSRIYKATGNPQLAMENFEIYIQMRDSINNEANRKASIKSQLKYEYDKEKAVADEKHASEMKQQEEKAVADKKRQNIIIASVSLVLLLLTVFSVILFNRFRVTQKQKKLIEQKELETRTQKHIIEEKHREITDSINYAERIQKSFLATESHLNANLTEYFVMFKPKDVVSGDFYWSATLNNGNFALATADSTGHGVPGAIMSLLNITSLEKAIEQETSPDKILNATRNIIIERLKKDGSTEGGKDGMDCSLCVFDFENKKLFVANAFNPIWIVRFEKGSLAPNVVELKPDKMPVGKHDNQDVPFTLKEHELQKGDVVYTLTDGFPDQFGGEKGKKFMSKNLRELVTTNSQLPLIEQKSLLEKTFADWARNLEQIDDVTVIGIRV